MQASLDHTFASVRYKIVRQSHPSWDVVNEMAFILMQLGLLFLGLQTRAAATGGDVSGNLV